jgi:pre-rRNA-processing protein TSR1
VHKSLLSFTRYFFPSVAKIHSADTPNESLLLTRALCEGAPSSIHHPEGRSWLVAEGSDSVSWESVGDDNGSPEQLGVLRVIGTVRGASMSANRLVHIPGHGDYQLDAVRPTLPSDTDCIGPLSADQGTPSKVSVCPSFPHVVQPG